MKRRKNFPLHNVYVLRCNIPRQSPQRATGLKLQHPLPVPSPTNQLGKTCVRVLSCVYMIARRRVGDLALYRGSTENVVQRNDFFFFFLHFFKDGGDRIYTVRVVCCLRGIILLCLKNISHQSSPRLGNFQFLQFIFELPS